MNPFHTLLLALVLAAGFITMGWSLLGGLPAFIFAVAALGGLLLWLFTTYRTPIDTRKVLPAYLLAILFFMAHVWEEYVTGFGGAISDLTGVPIRERDFLLVAAFVGPALWLSGALLILKRSYLGDYVLSFFFVAMTLAELAHFVFPFAEDGSFHYFPGMYTAALPLLPAGYGLFIVLREIGRERSRQANP